MKAFTRIILLVGVLASLVGLAGSAGCAQDTPYYGPQPFSSRGPMGTSAFQSGEASKTGLSPVKEGGLDSGEAPDAGSTGAGGGGGGVVAADVAQPSDALNIMEIIGPTPPEGL